MLLKWRSLEPLWQDLLQPSKRLRRACLVRLKSSLEFPYHLWLVVWNIFYFVHILGIIIPTDELIFFRGVAQPPTS